MAKRLLRESLLLLTSRKMPFYISGLFNACKSVAVTSKYQQLSFYCQKSEIEVPQDRIELYTESSVQNLLKQLTGKDYQRIFRKRKIGQKLREPKYRFMTENELQAVYKEAEENVEKLLQMPPVLRARKPIDKILSFDPYIQAFEDSTIILTDITMNISDRDRLIVARDPDGTLRHASWEERENMNSIYFPIEGRMLVTPKMFSDPPALQEVLNRASMHDNTYEFILDRACVQFEPDDPMYISVVEKTYETVNEKGHHDFLKSTRHYGPMVFYLVRTRRMDNLLLFNIQNERITDDAVPLISLFHLLFPDSKSKSIALTAKNDVQKIRQYIELDSLKKSQLELALNSYEELVRNRTELEEGLERAHGL